MSMVMGSLLVESLQELERMEEMIRAWRIVTL